MGNRVAEARQCYGEALPALVIDEPLGPPPRILDELARPSTERERLAHWEAAELVSRHPFTIRKWKRAAACCRTPGPTASRTATRTRK